MRVMGSRIKFITFTKLNAKSILPQEKQEFTKNSTKKVSDKHRMIRMKEQNHEGKRRCNRKLASSLIRVTLVPEKHAS